MENERQSAFVSASTAQPEKEAAVRNLEKTKKTIEMKQNPHPITVLAGAFVTFIFIYLLFLLLIASAPTGLWRAEDGHVCSLEYGRITGSIKIISNPHDNAQTFGMGDMKGAMIRLYGNDNSVIREGVWTGDQIIWIQNNGVVTIWDREIAVVPV